MWGSVVIFWSQKVSYRKKRLGNTEWSCICIRLEGKLWVGVEVELYSFVTWALDRGEWSVPRLRLCTSQKQTPATHRAGRTSEQVRTLKPHTAETFLRSYQALNYSRNSPHFMEHECSLSHSQQSATCFPSWARSIQSMLPHLTSFKIHFITR